ncbi:MAG: hypothetical protein JNL51_03945 [Chitinophagaceae bacterium]|nr:hypothetical protein [Chitinophagaceae bacterium]
MKSISRPSIFLGITSILIFLFGLFMVAGEYPYGSYILYLAMIVGAVYWIWGILDVTVAPDLKRYQKVFWLIIAISIPMIGAFLYQLMHRQRNKAV